MNMLLDFIITAIPLGMTFLFGCVGEILTEKAGHLNLGIPGIMCVGGTCGCVALKMLRNSGLPWPLIVVLAILSSDHRLLCVESPFAFLLYGHL